MPFITEEIWGLSGTRPKLLIHTDWPDYTPDALVDPGADHEMNWVIALIEAIRSARAQMNVPAGLQVPMLVSTIDDAGRNAWDRNETLIRRLARVESLTTAAAMPRGTVTIPVDGATFGLPLAGLIDIAAEKSRLEKALAKLAKDLGGLRGRLTNPKFAASAPDEVVEETRQNLAAREEEDARIRQALARLAELD
jgi:valyl-tRNA synthetase